MITDDQLTEFCRAVDQKIIANLGGEEPAQRIHGFSPCIFQRGPKFTRIVTCRNGQRESVFCFVDNETGTILKSAGWKTPDPKRHPRGNIANGADDVTPYGAVYLR